jgi:ATP adenylyltransferase
MSLKYTNLFSTHKLGYIKGDKPKVDCILCSIIRKEDSVEKLLIHEGRYAVVSVNKYPYNSGHLLIYPKRHITDYRELSVREEREICSLVRVSLNILEKIYSPSGYNIGYNIGEFSGASLPHLHMHIIPRYRNELGFIDIIGGAKIIVEDPHQTMKELRKAFTDFFTKDSKKI